MPEQQKPLGPVGQICPFNGKDTSKACHKCPQWVQLRGVDPQSGEEIDRWACSFSWLPKLLIENSAMQRQTGAAVESLRNAAIDKTLERLDRIAELMAAQLDLLRQARQQHMPAAGQAPRVIGQGRG